MERIGMLKKVFDPAVHHFPTEGRLTYEGQRIEYLADYTGPSPDGSAEYFNVPHDVAWCPALGVVVAFAEAHQEPFRLLEKRIAIRKLRK